MATSLAEQLRKLALPESFLQTDKKKKASLLFDPSEAANLDRDAFFEIGLDGLKGLIKLEPAFEVFHNNLFDVNSRQLERTVESKEINKKLDKNISKFLRLLSPYLLLKQSHKALEWLICRFQIHNFNIEALMELILPYHETKIFVRILRLINLNLHYCSHWKWLKSIQKEGVHLPKSVLINHAITDSSFLRFICDMTFKTIKENKKHNCAQKLGTLITFYSTTVVSVLSRESINDHQLTLILPSFMEALTSDLIDLKASGYMIAGQLVASNQVEVELLDKIISIILSEDNVLQKEKVLLLLNIFQSQKPSPNFPEESINNLMWLNKELSTLAAEGVQVGPLLLKVMETCLNCIIQGKENLVDAQVLSYTMATEISCDVQHCKNLIRLIDSSYNKLKGGLKSKSSDSQESDTLTWMKSLMDATVEKYREILDKDQADEQFQKLRDKWKSPDELAIQDNVVIDLMKKCHGENKESAWLQLRPLLLENIESDSIFEALCKVAPFYDNLVLLLCLEKLLNPNLSESNKLSKLSKIFKSKFGGNNPHIQEINNSITKNKTGNLTEVIETYFLKQQKVSENPIEFEPWLATLLELKQIQKISDGNEIWSLGLKILLAALPTTFSATYALQLLSVLASLKKKKIKIRFDILKSVISYLASNKKNEIKWYDLTSRDSEIWLKVRILEYILQGIYEDVQCESEYKVLLDDFSKSCFFNQQEFVRLLCSVCCGMPFEELGPTENKEYKISPLLQIYCLYVSWLQLKSDSATVFKSFQPELKVILCYLLMALANNSGAVRQASLKVLDALVTLLKNHQAYTEAILFDKLLSRSEEIALDANQVSVALYCVLSPCESVQATLHQASASSLSRARNVLLQTITDENAPMYVSLSIMQLLDTVNSNEIIEELSKLAQRALVRSKESGIPRMILANFWSRINETTSQMLEKEHIWELATKCIKHDKCDNYCPAVSCLKSITREVFENLSSNRKFQLVECMITTRSESESSTTASAIASAMKKLHLDCQIILPIINQMIALFSSPQRRKESAKFSQPTILESKEWKNGISLLELIQSKKKLLNSNVLIEPLFNVLKFCLDQEEQTTFEYTKHLVLGCLLDCCKKFSVETASVNESKLNVELVVQCLRASPNPQTHHHALMLLSHLSTLIPKQVMHNVMAIFTFMGTSVARLDDEHSVKIVTQVVDSVVPALVEAIRSENNDLQIVIAEILRVFVWAIKDIPQHRRKPLLLQLLSTLQPENSLWIFLLLLFENHVTQGDNNKTEGFNIPTNHFLGLNLCLSTSPKIVLESVVKIINYLMKLPIEKMNKEGRVQKDELVRVPGEEKKSDGLFDIEAHTPKQLRHFSYTILVFLNTLLADNNFIMQVGEQTSSNEEDLEEVLKETIASIMKYTPIVRKQLDKQQTKFWKAMVHQCYEVLDKFVLLVHNEMLLNVIQKLLHHSMRPLRRKALDLLNSLIQVHHEGFKKSEKKSLRKLLDSVVEIISTIGEEVEQEAVLLQQTALLTLKLLTKVLSSENIPLFKQILIKICKICKSKSFEGPLLGSTMLTVAELVTCLKAHSVSELPVFMPLMLKIFVKNSNPKTFNELGLNSITLAIHRVVDVLPNFLSPYLDKILYNVCTVFVKSADKSDLLKKLTQIRQKIGTNVEHRVLIPAVSRCYKKLIEDSEFEATGPLFSTLSCSFSASSDVSKVVPDITQLFISALSFRSDCEVQSSEVSLDDIDKVEENVIEALVPFVLKLSESLFKPLYYQLFHWASEHPDRWITFFRLSHCLAENLKGLFVLFAGHFLQKAATLLDATNSSKSECDYYGSASKGEAKAILLLQNILKTLHSIFLYDSTDSSNFLNKDKFEVLIHPLVDQLENTLGGIEELERRTSTLLTPCLAQMALATDDTLWKSLNYQVLLKSKSILPQVRIGALETIVAIAVKLGDDYLMLLPETIGSLAELLEDEDERVENAMKNAIQRLEDVLGQPIRDYFQ